MHQTQASGLQMSAKVESTTRYILKAFKMRLFCRRHIPSSTRSSSCKTLTATKISRRQYSDPKNLIVRQGSAASFVVNNATSPRQSLNSTHSKSSTIALLNSGERSAKLRKALFWDFLLLKIFAAICSEKNKELTFKRLCSSNQDNRRVTWARESAHVDVLVENGRLQVWKKRLSALKSEIHADCFKTLELFSLLQSCLSTCLAVLASSTMESCCRARHKPKSKHWKMYSRILKQNCKYKPIRQVKPPKERFSHRKVHVKYLCRVDEINEHWVKHTIVAVGQ